MMRSSLSLAVQLQPEFTFKPLSVINLTIPGITWVQMTPVQAIVSYLKFLVSALTH